METGSDAIRRLLIAIVIVGVVAGGSTLGWEFYELRSHANWRYRIEAFILKLAPRQPPNVTRAQWVSCVAWTRNLHSNWGGWSLFPDDQREAFEAEFERHLAGPVTLETINLIWDDYARFNPKARGYMQYRPTNP